MGKRNSQRKNAAMLDSDDDNSSESSTSTVRSDLMSVYGNEEVEVHKDSMLDQALDALYEKRGSTREKALSAIIEAFNSDLQHQFIEKKFATLLHQCLNSIKRGSSNEICLASHVIGLLALTIGCGANAREIFEESVAPISQALKTGCESSKKASLLECLAIVTFVGGNDPEETEKSMQIMWQLVHPKLGSNVIVAKPSAAVITSVVSAWSFLLATMDGWTLNPKDWQESISYFSGLLDKDDRSVRIAAGEAVALIFEMGSLEKFSAESKGSSDSSVQDGNRSRGGLTHIQGLKAKIQNQVRTLSAEAGGKGSVKKDLNNQRNLFRDVLESLEDGYCPETSMKIGGDSLQTSTWLQLIQLNYLKHFLAGGFVKHMQENEFLQDVIGFTPKKKYLQGIEHNLSSGEKRMYRSPNSVLNKARTQLLNKQRMIAAGKNVGHYAVNRVEEV
ncbi:IFRD_C domain-containing protein/IFRD domain-containing protein [Cephalotus follicularis]|uniref:IFRD_C domain-containing protein/IFRD domain-containing protein n=1 Tax=Cephalotus follicularis TaxID=3775 RepID=A0A1Q3ARA1_CEPFO|nr:IFRD_C domain-containing protein/IFRD domain-containing protein [Cephalotus follicularis]